METISKKELSSRVNNIKNKVSHINDIMLKNNEELDKKYEFAQSIGVKKDESSQNSEIIDGLSKYIKKTDEIINMLDTEEDNDDQKEEYKILSNMLYLDDVRLRSISELVEENNEIAVREYINKIANKANELIREEEIRSIDNDIMKLSKINFVEKITGKAKLKRALIENYSLKRVETMNKKYVPEGKSILEIVNIAKNSGFKSDTLDDFIHKLADEYELGDMIENSLAVIEKEKIPFFYNKQYMTKLNALNASLQNDITVSKKKRRKEKVSEINISNEALKNDVLTLELLNFNNVIDEVI